MYELKREIVAFDRRWTEENAAVCSRVSSEMRPPESFRSATAMGSRHGLVAGGHRSRT
jgi:hypothetical protein